MGCTSSCIAPSVAELSKSVKAGDERKLLSTLALCPKLLSTCTSMLSSTAVTPFHIACERKQVKAVEQVLSFLSCSTTDIVKEALMPYCRRMGKPLPSTVAEGVRLAVDMVNSKGQTPLMYACFADCAELVKLLLSHGADPWAGDRCGNRTPLHYAALGGSAACIAALMKHTPPRMLTHQGTRYVNARSCCGLTPLHYSVFFGHCEAIRELLHHDPQLNAASTSESYDVSVTCEVSSTPLHFAAVRGNEDAARELLQHYAQRLTSGQPIADPRDRADASRQLPWQAALAHHPANLSLAAMLHPGQNIHRVLGVAGSSANATPGVGPAPLATIAAAALRGKLLGQVRMVQQPQPGAAAPATAAEAARQSQSEQLAIVNGPCQALSKADSSSLACSGACRQVSALLVEAEGASRGQGRGSPLSMRVLPRDGGSGAAGSSSTHNECTSDVVLPATLPGWASRPPRRCRSAGSATTTCANVDGCAGPTGLQTSIKTAVGACGQLQNNAAVASAAIAASGLHDGGCVCSGSDADDDDELCGVCFVARQAVAPAGCGHGLCAECAEKLCHSIARKPLRCPFCRRVVTGLVAYTNTAGC